MALEYKDYYKILGVAKTATADEIKKAYRKMARKYHPDVSSTFNAEHRFKEVNEAYEVLKDSVKRRKYDSLGNDWQKKFQQRSSARPRPTAGSSAKYKTPPRTSSTQKQAASAKKNGEGSGFSDFFDALFGTINPFVGNDSKSVKMDGADQDAEIHITLEEAYHGGRKSIFVTTTTKGRFGKSTSERKRVEFRIPPGTLDGTKLRVPGKGVQGNNGGKNGNLYLTVHLQLHHRFKIDGLNLEADLNISPWEAALGATIAVPTLDGSVRIRIQPGTQSGRRVRIQKHGMPDRKTGGHGDLFFNIKIVVPEQLTDKEKSLFEQLSRQSLFNPR